MKRDYLNVTEAIASLFSVLLLSFAFVVEAQEIIGTGTATLSWTPPAEYVNGDPLDSEDIERYTVYFGPADPGTDPEPDDFENEMDIENGTVQSREIEFDLSEPTTMYFAMTATASGVESPGLSNITSKEIELEIDESGPNAPEEVEVDIELTCETDQPGVTCQFIVQ